ncbi:MAG: hypothetical protein JWN42_3052 [Candidatus Angelobacter sp.]|nr:hypothetical protein [Candidatus Angelobacter sp.]
MNGELFLGHHTPGLRQKSSLCGRSALRYVEGYFARVGDGPRSATATCSLYRRPSLNRQRNGQSNQEHVTDGTGND